VTAAGAAELTLDVWGDACRGRDQGPAAGRWLSRIIAGDPEAENPNRQIFYFPLFRESYINFLVPVLNYFHEYGKNDFL
jgi:hypothetical protein